MTRSKTISLVLGSGGARGLAHIGVIKALEANNFSINSISGCSMGALIGGVYAAGKLDEFTSWVCALNKVDIFRMLDLTWSIDGFVKGDKIINKLIDIVGDITIEQLPIQFTAIAADVQAEKEVWLNSGSLFDAIRASISLPLFFTPVPYKNNYLIDGGVLNPVPIAPTFSDDTDMTIAVNLAGSLSYAEEEVAINSNALPKDNILSTASDITDKVSAFIDKLSGTNNETPPQKDWGMYNIANQAFDAMQSTIARQKLAAYPPDIEITIARNACQTLDFHLAKEMIALGKEKTEQALK